MKKLRIVLIVFAVIIVLWSGMLITDIVKSNNFQEPVFAKLSSVEPNAFNDLVYEYQGLGYTVRQEDSADEDGNVYPLSSEVRLFGILVSAIIT